jgi:hypothetical protein
LADRRKVPGIEKLELSIPTAFRAFAYYSLERRSDRLERSLCSVLRVRSTAAFFLQNRRDPVGRHPIDFGSAFAVRASGFNNSCLRISSEADLTGLALGEQRINARRMPASSRYITLLLTIGYRCC